MGIFPVPQSIPFVPILIPISSHSPIPCPLQLVSTCCSFIIREIGCFTGQTFYRKVSISVRLSMKAWKTREKSLCSSAAPWPGKHHFGTALFCANNGNGLFLALYRVKNTTATMNVTTCRAATKQKCHPPANFCRHLFWRSNSASKTKEKKKKWKKGDAAFF